MTLVSCTLTNHTTKETIEIKNLSLIEKYKKQGFTDARTNYKELNYYDLRPSKKVGGLRGACLSRFGRVTPELVKQLKAEQAV